MQSLKRRHYECYLLWGQLQLHDGGPGDKRQQNISRFQHFGGIRRFQHFGGIRTDVFLSLRYTLE